MSLPQYYRIHPTIKKLHHPNAFKIFRNQSDRLRVAKLPLAYQKFYTEWMDSEEKETPVHWTPKPGRWEKHPESGKVNPIQNVGIPVNYPYEHNEGLWGGEGVIQGLVKKGKWRSPVPRYWTPTLKRSIVFSEVLNVYLSVVVTERALQLIDDHHGLDNYLMMTPAYDLKSLLALKLKKKIMLALLNRDFCHNDPKGQQEILDKFQEYMLPREDVEWYGLSVEEAMAKAQQIKEASYKPTPLKVKYRAELLEELRAERDKPETEIPAESASSASSWVSKLNPFSKY